MDVVHTESDGSEVREPTLEGQRPPSVSTESEAPAVRGLKRFSHGPQVVADSGPEAVSTEDDASSNGGNKGKASHKPKREQDFKATSRPRGKCHKRHITALQCKVNAKAKHLPKMGHSDVPTSPSAPTSPETTRIRAARKRAGKASSSKAEVISPCCTSEDSSEDMVSLEEMPKTSGVFDFIEWVVVKRLHESERQAICSKSPWTTGEMCAGMGSLSIILNGLHQSMHGAGYAGFAHMDIFKCESDAGKLAFLQRHKSDGCRLFSSNAALVEDMPQDISKECGKRPVSRTWSCGIVCKDISGMTNTPKSIEDDGKSGKAFKELLESLEATPFEDRPVMINLECVARLGERRRVDAGLRAGTEYIDEALSKLGYTGAWRKVRPRNFYLPQSRPRVYSIHYKRKHLGPEAEGDRRRDLERAFGVLARLQTPVSEGLGRVLQRVAKVTDIDDDDVGKKVRHESRSEALKRNRKWPAEHESFAEEHGISAAERQPPTDFVEQVGKYVSHRSLEAMWLKVLVWSKKRRTDWRKVLVVLPVSFSIGYASVRLNHFPCVTPTHRYVVVNEGKAMLANGRSVMAMQGIQAKEYEAMNFASEKDVLLRDLAGNAFTANIMAAFFIAGAIAM